MIKVRGVQRGVVLQPQWLDNTQCSAAPSSGEKQQKPVLKSAQNRLRKR